MDDRRTTHALLIEGLRKTFDAADDEQVPVRALRGLDMNVGRGEFVAVMGPSGCGKSTLLNLVAGLEAPTDGAIAIDGEPITAMSDDELAVMRRRHIGIVFQFFNLLEGMSVQENVALPMVVAGRSRKQADTRARDLLDLLGIADKAAKTPGVLSGVSASASRSPVRSPTNRRSCLPMSRRGRWTRRVAPSPGSVPASPRRRADDRHGDAR